MIYLKYKFSHQHLTPKITSFCPSGNNSKLYYLLCQTLLDFIPVCIFTASKPIFCSHFNTSSSLILSLFSEPSQTYPQLMDLVHIAHSHFLFPNTDFCFITSLVKLNIACLGEGFFDQKTLDRFPQSLRKSQRIHLHCPHNVCIHSNLFSPSLQTPVKKIPSLCCYAYIPHGQQIPGPEKVLNKWFLNGQKLLISYVTTLK